MGDNMNMAESMARNARWGSERVNWGKYLYEKESRLQKMDDSNKGS